MTHTIKPQIERVERIHLTISPALRREISLWRHGNLIPSEMEAIRQLLRRALDAEAKGKRK